MTTKIAAFVFKYSILFPGCFVPLLFPGIVDMMARSIVQRKANGTDYGGEFRDSRLWVDWFGEFIDIYHIADDGQSRHVRSLSSGKFERGFWLLDLWRAL